MSSPQPSTQGDLEAIRIYEPLCAVFRRKLRSVGLKYTPERAAILDAIVRGEQVFEADRVVQDMRAAKLRVSKATVYRTIKLLAEAGIIQQVLFDSEQAHYQLAYGSGSKGGGGLLVNVDTRQITPIDLPELVELRERICRERGLSPQGHRFVVYACEPGGGLGKQQQTR